VAMHVTFFPDQAARRMRVADLSLEQFADEIRRAHAPTKERLPWFKLAVFGDKKSEKGSLRNNANVVSLSGIELDYDGGKISIKIARRIIGKLGLRCIIYTTPSNRKGNYRWRAAFPFSKNLSARDRDAIFDALVAALMADVEFSKESRTLSQSYYYGRVDGGPEVQIEILQGEYADVDLSNPFLIDTDDLRTSMDWEGALARMTYRSGDDGIHMTQLRVCASLASQGWDRDEAVGVIIEATRRACEEAGRDWTSWERGERKRVGGMWDDWEKKREKEDVEVQKLERSNGGSEAGNRTRVREKTGNEDGSNVVGLDGQPVAAKPVPRITKKNLHVALAEIYVGDLREGDRDVLRVDEEWWAYGGGAWNVVREKTGNEVHEASIGIVIKRHLKDTYPTKKLVGEVLAEVKRLVTRTEVAWDEHGLLPVANGLLDLVTLALRPAAATDYCTYQLPWSFDEASRCPTWLQMLADRFLPEEIVLLQEVCGAPLISDRDKDLRRVLIQVGGSNAGKSALISVMCALYSRTTITTSIEDLDKPHGTVEFRRRVDPWRLDEAFDQGKWHLTSTLKTIVSGEPFSVNVKNGPRFETRWDGAAFWGTNNPVQFREQTRAIENRVVILDCAVEFDPSNPVGAAKIALARGYRNPADLVLSEEMPGVLAWAVEGARRLRERGHYDLPDKVRESLHELRSDSNPLVSFFEECVEYDGKGMVSVADFHYAFCGFAREEMRNLPSTKSLGRWLKALNDPRTGFDRNHTRLGNRKFYVGMQLSSTGLDYWSARAAELSARGQHTPGSADRPEDVNQGIPATWGRFELVRRVRAAIEKSNKKQPEQR
jgi:phage/plasmid-associated DNA primase